MSHDLEKNWEEKLMRQLNNLSIEQREQIGKQVVEMMAKLHAKHEEHARQMRPTEEQLNQRFTI